MSSTIPLQSDEKLQNQVQFSISDDNGSVTAMVEITTSITEETPSGEQTVVIEPVSIEISGTATLT
jgi:hypothetical protein